MPLVKVRMGKKPIFSKNVAATKKDKIQDRQISMLKKKVKQLAPELKYFDNSFGLTPDYTTGTVSALNNMAQGTTDVTRIGDTITNSGFSMRGYVLMNPTLTEQVCTIGIVHVPKSDDIPAVSDLFQVLTVHMAPMSHVLWDNKANFRWIWRKIFVMDSDHPTKQYNVYKKLKTKTQFSGGSTTYTSGAYYLVTLSGNSNTLPPVVYGRIRWTYRD